ncbi:2-dehydropantoate 2-reductase [Sphingomonas sp. TF3]|uniref:ketopantoate reductase family protein n=1 Tax=Sphingomonas sp. TF3 TaxID=2495580 RepID=UPI000F89B3A1|nr:2-dehydropantoate 2-reductase [Sphingomonas sp. TF3]RUN76532.1 2-dehydropantoate 2-reductase [Sphingomonas sp. TF3]
MTKVCIFGAGAIGGHIAAHLARGGRCEVSVVARGATLAAIRADGVRVMTSQEDFTARVAATDAPETLGPQDFVLLTLKAHQLDAALPRLGPLIGDHTAILPPTTGLPAAFLHGLGETPLPLVDPTGTQLRTMPPAQVLGIVYWIGAHAEGPGIIRQDGARATCMVGELDGTISGRATTLARLLSDAGIPTPVRHAIRGDIWIKFVNSLCWNPVAVLTGATNGAIGDDAQAIGTVRRMMEEADAVAARLGIAVPVAAEKRIAVTLSARGHKMSMLQDLEHGSPLEIDALARSIAAARHLADLPTPTIDALLSLIALRSQTPQETLP